MHWVSAGALPTSEACEHGSLLDASDSDESASEESAMNGLASDGSARAESASDESASDDSDASNGPLAGLAASMWAALQRQRQGLPRTSTHKAQATGKGRLLGTSGVADYAIDSYARH